MLASPLDSLILRGLLGAVVAGVVAALARRAGSLSASGQWAAFVMGTVVTIAGWGWAALLIWYFVVAAALTRYGAAVKAARTASTLPDAQARSAVQVLANGGVFTVLVVVGAATGDIAYAACGAAALAAAAADTWATEIGTLRGGTPRSIATFKAVEPGMSGGVTLVGSVASVVGALSVAIPAVPLITVHAGDTVLLLLLAAGIAGSIADSILGATLQSKRWCEQCRTWTERRVHTCQYRTQHLRGVRWMTNDTVNLLATLVGALYAAAVVLWPQ